MDGWMDGWVDGWMGGWMDGWMGGWMDGWMYGLTRWMDGSDHFNIVVHASRAESDGGFSVPQKPPKNDGLMRRCIDSVHAGDVASAIL